MLLVVSLIVIELTNHTYASYPRYFGLVVMVTFVGSLIGILSIVLNLFAKGMRLRLSDWQILGIVASGLWLIGAGRAWVVQQTQEASKAHDPAYNICLEVQIDEGREDFQKCDKEGTIAYEITLKHRYANAAALAFGPLSFAWLLAYAIVGVWRWVRRGFVKELEKI